MTVNYEYSRSIRENLRLPIQLKLSQKLYTFYIIVVKYLQSISKVQSSPKKKVTPIGQVFLKLLTRKYLLI